jgi:hypothetical protein
MSIATASDLEITRLRPLTVPFAAAAVCVALADWLFYRWQVGISLAIFLAVLGIVAAAGNRVRATRHTQIVTVALFVAGLLPLIEDISILSVTVGALTTAQFVLLMTGREVLSWQRNLFDAATVPFRGPFQLAGDALRALRWLKGWSPEWLTVGSLIAWIVPLGAFAVFLALFSSANPLIEYRLMQIDLRVLFNLLDPLRIGFWILVVCLIWPLVLRRSRKPWEPEPRTAIVAEPSDFDHFFGVQAVTRPLILFNALFALQSGLDLTYLWGGANLPGGMSHAEYAHRGAYPLIVTALLAAGFVLIAMRPGGPAEKSRLIRPLVLLWTGQNVLLVISSIFRLDLYVAAYSLTYLRLAAFIWMALVAVGLLLMLIQTGLKKPISWLIAVNAASLALVLYGCCFINAPQIIASYNVEHCQEIGGNGPRLDLGYLLSLGPQVLPVLEPRLQHIAALQPYVAGFRFDQGRRKPAGAGNWRAWTFQTWRLERYLAKNPDTPSNSSDGGKG